MSLPETPPAPRPGRPKGSGLDDSKTLARMAALLASGEETTVAGAARRAGADNDATIRRLQRKFSERQEDLMEAHNAASELCAENAERAEKRLRHLRFLFFVSLLSSTIGAMVLFGAAGFFLVALLLPVGGAASVLLGPKKPSTTSKVGQIVNRTLSTINCLASCTAISIPLWPTFAQWTGPERMIGWLVFAMGLSVASSEIWGFLLKRGKTAKDTRYAFAFGSLAGCIGMVSAMALPVMLMTIGVFGERLEERAALWEATTSILREELGDDASKRVAQRLTYVIMLTAVDRTGIDTDSYQEWLSSVACSFRFLSDEGCGKPAIDRIRNSVSGSIDYVEANRVASEKVFAEREEKKRKRDAEESAAQTP